MSCARRARCGTRRRRPHGSGGNPLLDPFLANQVDVSFEWYFRPEALAAIAVFYKDVDTHIGYDTQPATIDGITYAVTGPFNGEGGPIAGVELTFQTPFAESGALQQLRHLRELRLRRHRREGVLSGDRIRCRSEGYAENTAAVDLWYSSSVFEARLGYKYHSPFTHHRGLERLGRSLAGRGVDPRPQHVLAGQRHVRSSSRRSTT